MHVARAEHADGGLPANCRFFVHKSDESEFCVPWQLNPAIRRPRRLDDFDALDALDALDDLDDLTERN
jgi:hypothetical protein